MVDRVASSEITISDISDGTNPITAFATNANHTFHASSTGSVTNVSGFTSSLVVFVGQTQATYVGATLGSTANTFAITSAALVGSPSGWTLNSVSGAGALTFSAITTTATPAVTLRVTYDVRTTTDVTITGLTTDISLTIVKEGSGGQVIELVPSKLTFFANSTGVLDASQDDIVVGIETQGITGNISFFTSLNGSAFIQRTATGTGAGQIAFYDDDLNGSVSSTGDFLVGQNAVKRIGITQANLGDAGNTLSIKVTGATGGFDVITVFKVQKGAQGTGAIMATLSSDNGILFKNSAGANKTLTATVLDADTGASPAAADISYEWTRANGAGVRVSTGTRNVIASGGVSADGTGDTYKTIVLDASDISSQEKFKVSVTVAD